MLYYAYKILCLVTSVNQPTDNIASQTLTGRIYNNSYHLLMDYSIFLLLILSLGHFVVIKVAKWQSQSWKLCYKLLYVIQGVFLIK